MSKTVTPAALDIAARVAATLPTSNREHELQARVKELEQRIESLKPAEHPLAKMFREQDEFLNRFEEERKRQAQEAALALEQARDAERLRQASLPQAPTTEQIRAIADALGQILSGDAYGSSSAREQEIAVWPRWCALCDALEAATAIPTNGWNPDVVKVLKLATEAVEGLARSWGLTWSLKIGKDAREAQAASKIEAWKRRWDRMEKMDALMWVSAYEKGEAPRPDNELIAIANVAKAEGIVPRSPPQTHLPAGVRAPRELENGGLIPALVALTAKQKSAVPALGSAHPKLSNESRYDLSEVVRRLRQGLPYEPPERGLIMNGRVVLPPQGSSRTHARV